MAGTKANGTKRAVFADVSNVGRATVKDDIQMAGKEKENIVLKDSSIVSTKESFKPNALLRPAQRPLANVAAKVNASVTTESVVVAAPKHVTLDAAHGPGNARKALTKKATTVFREAPVDPTEVYPDASKYQITEPTAKAELTQGIIDRIEEALAGETAAASIACQTVNTRKVSEVSSVDSYPLADVAKETHASVEKQLSSVDVHEYTNYVDALEEKAHALNQDRDEEYWDEDEEEEYYDADGYTTARSLRSRGDTTGGVTLVLAPRVTAKSKRELEAAKQFVDTHKTLEDLEDEQWDTSMVAEYGEEIFEYMHQLEERMKPNASYMDLQAEIQWSMRSVLMDWLVQVHNRFTLLPETLFLSVNYVDRFLSAKVVSLGKLQLVGATALFLAAKYEEINCPSVQEIVYMVDGAYSGEEVLKAERFMLSMLQFELGWPGPMSFLRRISKADDYDLETRTLAKYFLEITIMDERFVGCTPSFLAAGAHCLARFMLKKGDWVCFGSPLACCQLSHSSPKLTSTILVTPCSSFVSLYQ